MREPGMSDVFRRDLDRIEVPAEAIWVPAQRRRSPIRSILAIAGASALVIAAAIGGSALRVDDVGGPSASVLPPAGTSSDAFDVLVGGRDGTVHVVRDLQLHRSITACAPSTNVVSVAGALDDRTLLVRCSSVLQPGGHPPRTPPPRVPDIWLTLRVDTGSVARLDALSLLQPESVALSPTRDQVALRMVDCVPSRCAFTIAVATLATGQVRTILEPSEDVTGLRWTTLGISVYRLAPHERGTYLYEGATWRKLSDRHLLHADGAGRMLMEETVPAVLGRSGGVLWERTATGDRALTDGQQTAYGVALFEPDGALVVTLGDGSHIDEYRGGRVTRSIKGAFCATAERFRDWFVCMPSSTTEDRVAMYSIATGEHRDGTVTLPLRAHGTAIAVLPRVAIGRLPLGTSIGTLRLGANEAEVRSLLGPPATETLTHGQGGPEWQYPNGTIVRFAGAGGTVWQIVVRAGSAGRTAENFGIGDSREAFASAYREFPLSSGVPDDQVQVNSGGFGPGGRTLNVTFTAGRASIVSLTSSLAQ